MLHRCAVLPCRKRAYSDLTGCETSSIYGYRATCSCGFRGKVLGRYVDAREDLLTHRQEMAKG